MFALRNIRTFGPPSAALLALLALAAGTGRASNADSSSTHRYFYVQAGQATSVHSSGGLRGSSPQSLLALGIGQRLNSNLSVEFEALAGGTGFDGPAIGDQNFLSYYSDHRDYVMAGATGWVRVSTEWRRLSPYARAGIGIHSMSLSSTGVEMLFFPSVRESQKVDPAFQVAVGTEIRVGERTFLGIESRYLELQENFAPVSPGRVNVGGGFWTASFRRGLGADRRRGLLP